MQRRRAASTPSDERPVAKVRLKKLANGGPAFPLACATQVGPGSVDADIAAVLGMRAARRRCAVFTSDVRVRVAATGLDTYPDGTVVCGRLEHDPLDPHAIANPTLLVEVTSPSTEAYDRGEKLNHYKRIPALQEVAIVSHGERRVEVWSRSEEDWRLERFGASEQARLASLDAALPVDEIYADPLT